ncbi:heptaprenyl diphosphate synthase component 1 [Paenibacillus sp. y28]|uniref:heptaprenyl diphosphate synthase component 1 n=1 Tax=Paenibacillus sp. y28 TaxID=3129110 RepID=UPI0030186630
MNSYRIPEIAKKYTDYDMIQTNTELPEFPHYRVRLLFAFLNKSGLPQESTELYALVTSLAQMGLDTHQLVSETNDVKETKAARSRQLQVLAGDYFSSRFYQLLSQAGHTEMTRQLSGAICEVNRLKMSLYVRMKQLKCSAEEYLQETVNIRMQLFLLFGRWMKDIYSIQWAEILEAFTRCEVLIHEIDRSNSLQELQGSWGYWYILQTGSKEEKRQLKGEQGDGGKLRSLWLKHNVKAQLYQMLQQQLALVQDKIGHLGSEKLTAELAAIGEPLVRYLSAPKVLEEI